MMRTALVAGERPEPLEWTYTDADGVVVDLTGYDGALTWQRDSDGASGEIAGTVDEVAGTVSVVLSDAACSTPGVVDVTVWAGNGTNRYASPTWRLLFSDPPGTPPSI